MELTEQAAVHDIQWTGDDCSGCWGFCGSPSVWRCDDGDEGDRLSLGKGRSRRLRELGGKERPMMGINGKEQAAKRTGKERADDQGKCNQDGILRAFHSIKRGATIYCLVIYPSTTTHFHHDHLI